MLGADSQKTIGRFEAHFEKCAGCWHWKSNKCPQGYGKFKIGTRTVRAHRFSYEAYIGTIPDGLFVCHTCDNPSCVNPKHLFVGTPKQNTQDMMAKGRSRLPPRSNSASILGENNWTSKLKAAQVLQIRRRIRSAESIAAIGRDYGVSESTIHCIRAKRNWAWLKDDGDNV